MTRVIIILLTITLSHPAFGADYQLSPSLADLTKKLEGSIAALASLPGVPQESGDLAWAPSGAGGPFAWSLDTTPSPAHILELFRDALKRGDRGAMTTIPLEGIPPRTLLLESLAAERTGQGELGAALLARVGPMGPRETLLGCQMASEAGCADTVSRLIDNLMGGLKSLDEAGLVELKAYYQPLRELLLEDSVHRLGPEFTSRLKSPESEAAAFLSYYWCNFFSTVWVVGTFGSALDTEWTGASTALRNIPWLSIKETTRMIIVRPAKYAVSEAISVVLPAYRSHHREKGILGAVCNLTAIYWGIASSEAKFLRTRAFEEAVSQVKPGTTLIREIRQHANGPLANNPYIKALRNLFKIPLCESFSSL